MDRVSFDDRRKLTTGEEIVEDILNDVLDRIELEAAKAELNRLKSKKKTLKKNRYTKEDIHDFYARHTDKTRSQVDKILNMPRHQKYSIDEIMDKIKEQYVDGPERKRLQEIKRRYAPSNPVTSASIHPNVLKASNYNPGYWLVRGTLPSTYHDEQRGHTGDGDRRLGFRY